MATKTADVFGITCAADIIRRGGLVAFPTETVYGLGADAFNDKAVAKIFEIKKRPAFDPLIVHIASAEEVTKLAINSDENVCLLAKTFWPGPLTVVLPKKNDVPEIVTAGLSTVAVRMPDHPAALKLIKAAGCPLAAPSANKFGCLSPTAAAHVEKQLPGVDCILDGGATKIGIESTVIQLDGDKIRILRYGAITIEKILEAVPWLKIIESPETPVVSPGMLKAHYRPNKPFFILGDMLPQEFKKERGAILLFSGAEPRGYKMKEHLTRNKDLTEYAANLFSALHRLEDADIEFIIAEAVPEQGLGLAIMDRLKKAAYRDRKE